MDEPTSALSVSEALQLHEIIRRLAGEGVAVVYISHRMEEIFELCHAVTVLRDGALVGTVPIGQTSRAGLIRMMAGRDVQEFFHRGEPQATDGVAPTVAASPVLSVRGLWLANPTTDGAAPAPGRRRRSRHRRGRGGGPRRSDGRRPYRAAGNPVRGAGGALRWRGPRRRPASPDQLAARGQARRAGSGDRGPQARRAGAGHRRSRAISR